MVQYPVTEQTTQDATENLQLVNSELKRLLDDRHNKLPVTGPAILAIHRDTVRVEKNKVAREKEFVTESGKPIRKDALYHIHYTKNLTQHYMTGAEHNPNTKLIYRKSLYENDFDYYNSLNKQQVVTIKNNITLPTEEDYAAGGFTRYFAKKANDLKSPPFEISVDDFEVSPLYIYASLIWYIKGDKSIVLDANNRQIETASKIITNVGKLLPDYQHFRTEENLSPKDLAMQKLGMLTQQSEESNTEQSTTQQTQTTPPPSPTTAGGAGMASGAGAGSGGGGY